MKTKETITRWCLLVCSFVCSSLKPKAKGPSAVQNAAAPAEVSVQHGKGPKP